MSAGSIDTMSDNRTPADHASAHADKMERARASVALLDSLRPAWAQALIVAELQADESDSQSDYFGSSTTRCVALAWSKHTKDLFAEMRKAAARFPATAHLGPGCDLYYARVIQTDDVYSNGAYYHKGDMSHWHSECYGDDHNAAYNHGRRFATLAAAQAFVDAAPVPEPIAFNSSQADAKIVGFAWHISHATIEYREKYSMGHGYYLTADDRHSGWQVRKVAPANFSGSYRVVELDLLPGAPVRSERGGAR